MRPTVKALDERMDRYEVRLTDVASDVTTVKVDVASIRAYMENAGLHNGTAETVAAVLAEGGKSINKRQVNHAFFSQNFGWVPTEFKELPKAVAFMVTLVLGVLGAIQLYQLVHLPLHLP